MRLLNSSDPIAAHRIPTASGAASIGMVPLIDQLRQQQNWIICQLGAREHYVLAAELHARGRLAGLVTDSWLSPDSLLARLPWAIGRRAAERYEHSLCEANVHGIPLPKLAYQTFKSYLTRHKSGWRHIIAKNEWFTKQVSQYLVNSGLLEPTDRSRPFVFAYSYAARRILETARLAGCHTILGQIDPGLAEEDVVAEAALRHGLDSSKFDRAPAAYWENWREECALANDIVVNSAWSRECLIRAGIVETKIKIVPLAYKNRHASQMPPHNYPTRFTPDRPLKVLFLGQISVRKGVIELLEAAYLMKGAPVVFQMVGPDQLAAGTELRKSVNVEFIGAVPRSKVARYYAEADIFILPTLSDGFGLAQIEAQSYGLPVLSSQRCGEVVRDYENGRVIHPVTADSICDIIGWCLRHPDELRGMSVRALAGREAYEPSRVVDALTESVGGAS